MANGAHHLYVCGCNAYDNELAMYRHEGIACHARCSIATVFDARPRMAYRISHDGAVQWSTDLVDVYRIRRRRPDAEVVVVAVRR